MFYFQSKYYYSSFTITILIFNFLCFFYFSGIDVTPYLKNIPYIGEKLDSSSTAGASTFVIAYAVNKGGYEKM